MVHYGNVSFYPDIFSDAGQERQLGAIDRLLDGRDVL